MAKPKLRDALLLPKGAVDLSSFDSGATPGFDGDKADAPKAMESLASVLGDRQERLFAGGRAGVDRRRALLVLQGMDTSGKGGIVRHAVGLLDPQGVAITSFKAPTRTELRHDFLWRIERALPPPGMVGIFDRSQYEDVLIARVRKLADATEIRRRYAAINDFEARLVADGVTVIKCFLHITKDDQAERLAARLDDPTKHWKYNPGDIEERALWDSYQRAYELALKSCAKAAPWYLVPSGRKWYRNWAVAALLAEHLADLDLQWPEADFDVEEEQRRLAAT